MLVCGPAHAVPTLELHARVAADLRTIVGTLTAEQVPTYELLDVQPLLPMPEDDRTQLRTFPGRPEQGRMHVVRLDERTWEFTTVLPRRFDASGVTRQGLFVNGGWYPQPVAGGKPLVARYDVHVSLPTGTTGVVSDQIGRDEVHWTGTADWIPIAVVRRAEVVPLEMPAGRLDLVTHGSPRKVLVRELTREIDRAQIDGITWEGAIVEAPLRRRLTRSGPGLAYVSDRAFRLTPPLQRVHRVAVTRGVVEALVEQPEDYLREVAAAGISRSHAEELSGPSARRALKLGAWTPTVDALLYDRTLPFGSEILEDVHPGDVLEDDVGEVLGAHAPGTAVAAQLDLRFGAGTSLAMAEALCRGWSDEASSSHAGVDPDFLRGWNAPYPEQDYRLTVHADAIEVVREAPAQAPLEAVPIRVGPVSQTFFADPGDTLRLDRTVRGPLVVVDPERITEQASRASDRWPPRYTVTGAAWVDTVNLRRGYIEAAAATWVRRTDDTHNLGFGNLVSDQENRLAATAGYLRKAGPLVNGLRRQHRIWGSLTASWLNPEYATAEYGPIALGVGAGWGWDDRTGEEFPLRGGGVGVSVGTGFVPGSVASWQSARAAATGLVPLHPRHVLAGRVMGWAGRSEVAHRLVSLGGPSALRSVPSGLVLANGMGMAAAEYRWAPLRNVSVPVGLAWGSELQLTAGVEGGVGVLADEVADLQPGTAMAAGATAGLAAVGDVLGALPALMGVTAAWPLWWEGVELERTPVPEIYLRWWQEF